MISARGDGELAAHPRHRRKANDHSLRVASPLDGLFGSADPPDPSTGVHPVREISTAEVGHRRTKITEIRLPFQAFSYDASGVEKINGKAVTEQDIKTWADEAERGYDTERLRKRGRRPLGNGPTHIVPVRIDGDLLAALTERADHDHVSRSEAIRKAIRNYVA